MKNTIFSIIFICSIFIIMTLACERTDLQKSSVNSIERIAPRSEFCTNCDEDDCCCSIELKDLLSSANLRLCGTADGIGSCSGIPLSPCASFSGGGQIATLNPGNPKKGFCMVKGNAFYIKNGGPNPAQIIITCQDDLTSPQAIIVTIPVDSIYYYGTNNSCVIDACE